MAEPLTMDTLRREIEDGRIEGVVVALGDLQGRLQGSRLGARYFLDHALADGFDCCSYLLAVDVDMQTGPGYAIDAGANGFADFTLRFDDARCYRLPWQEATALVVGDPVWHDGTPVAVSPRQVLRTQLDALGHHGLTAHAGTELEFLVFREPYRTAWERRYQDLTPATRFNSDYALTGLAELDPVVRRIRREMEVAGLEVESARGECHPGQYEIVFRYREASRACDDHLLYTHGVREIAGQEGMAATFMARYDEGEGSSCHVHLSLRAADGTSAMADEDGGMTPLMEHVVAGQLACLPELTLLFAPNVNSYKRLQPGGFAPTAVAWGRDDRRCPVRVAGDGPNLRIEHRVAGADATPHLAVAAIVAAARHGIDHRLALDPPATTDPTADPTRRQLPRSLDEAVAQFAASSIARKAFGDEVVDHLVRAGEAELAAFRGAVTDWERVRGFERG